MKKTLVLLAVLFLASSLMVACGGDKKESRSGEDQRAMTSAPEQDKNLRDRPPFEAEGISRSFIAAETYFKNGQLDHAARELRTAAVTVDQLAGKGDSNAKQQLKSRAEDLRFLARDVEAGSVKSVDELDRIFYRTYNSLADYHFQAANEYWGREMVNEAGQSLETAGDYLDEASTWGGRKIDSATQKAVDGARSAARRIRSGARWTASEIGDAFTGVGDRIKDQGENIDDRGQNRIKSDDQTGR